MQNDLISRSALLEPLKNIEKAFETEGNDGLAKIMQIHIQFIEGIPTVDAVEVCRCKDCKHYELGVCLKIYSDGAVSQYAWQERRPEDFCSYGERREDGGK